MTDQNATLAAIGALLAANGLTVDDVAAHLTGAGTADNPTGAARVGPTLGEYIPVILHGLTTKTARTWKTHLSRLAIGTPPMCDCLCDHCLDLTTGCACSADCKPCEKSRLGITAAAERPMADRQFPNSELKVNVVVSTRMAQKKARADNKRRAAKGLAPKPEHGHGGAENAITAYRNLFRTAIADDYMSKNPAMDLHKPARQESKRRALTDRELPEVFDAVVTGGDDPELDFFLTWFHVETGARREGGENLRVCDLRGASQTIEVFEKFDVYRTQPVSRELLDALDAFARHRGGPDLGPLSPVFYLKRRRSDGGPWPLTSRRYDTLHKRIQLTLPWANEISLSSHCLRHTGATVVERIAGTQVARKFLGHGRRNPTDGYTKAGLAEVAAAVSTWTGSPHPLAEA